MTALQIKNASLIGLRGEVHALLAPTDIEVNINVSAGNVEGQPQMLTIGMDLEVRTKDADDGEDAEEVHWASVGARYGLEVAAPLPGGLTEDLFRGLFAGMWPQLRERCLTVLADLGLAGVQIPFDPSEVVSEGAVSGSAPTG